MKVLEFFAGSRSIGKVCDELGYECFSTDIKDFDGIDLVKDILQLTRKDIPFVPNIIWGSPICTTYSIAAISHHRDMGKPKTELAVQSDKIVKKFIEIIKWFPEAKWYIENPVGYLRKMDFMRNLNCDRATVTYCQYGDTRMKPTDIWTNNLYTPLFNENGWFPRPMCKNGDTCHEAAPRGSRTGTQGLKNAHERSKIPYGLCMEILN